MKFIDKKYICFIDEQDAEVTELDNVPLYILGFPSTCDDISVDLKINQKDNSLSIQITEECAVHFNFTEEESNRILIDVRDALIAFPYPSDNHEMIFENL